MKAEYIDHMGDDLAVVNAAKVSFAKELSELDDSSVGLINYLAKHDHWTPFGHCMIKLRMQSPVPIRTQCFKHKQGLTENEESRRYISTTPELFIPEYFRSKPEGSIKQGSGGRHVDSDSWLNAYEYICRNSISTYEDMLEDGVCPEQARFILPQGCEVNWIWTGSLYAFANFYLKRTAPNSQKEIQVLAKDVGDIIQPLFPVSWEALTK